MNGNKSHMYQKMINRIAHYLSQIDKFGEQRDSAVKNSIDPTYYECIIHMFDVRIDENYTIINDIFKVKREDIKNDVYDVVREIRSQTVSNLVK